MGRYTDIIARLESASGPDRELDFAIAETLGALPRNRFGDDIGVCRPVTASLDAAIGLVERVLPDAYRASGRTGLYPGMIPGSSPYAYWAEVGDWGSPSRAGHDREPIALLLALFRALEAQEAGE